MGWGEGNDSRILHMSKPRYNTFSRERFMEEGAACTDSGTKEVMKMQVLIGVLGLQCVVYGRQHIEATNTRSFEVF